jgi:hypothetical protein
MCQKIPCEQLRNFGAQSSELHIKLLDGLRDIILLIPLALGLAAQEKSLCENSRVTNCAKLSERLQKFLIPGIAMNIEMQSVAAIHNAPIIFKHAGCGPLDGIQRIKGAAQNFE